MKQLIQNYKNGKLELLEVPAPKLLKKTSLVKNVNSVISVGTEKLMIDLAKKNLIGKAIARPDLLRKVIGKVKTDGVKEALNQALNRLDEPMPLGYSCAGEIVDIDPEIVDFKIGDRVACYGSKTASHSEIVRVPRNQMIKIPKEVSFEEAAFVAIGGIALHSIRLSGASIGSRIAIIGLGLLGQVLLQILKSMSCEVSGFEIDKEKLKLAKKLGLDNDYIVEGSNFLESYNSTNGFGFDSVIIATNSPMNNQPIILACKIVREKGKVILLGQAKVDIERKILFEKEIDFLVSRSTGPGVFDEQYEINGIDYPISYIRWTQKRNMEVFLNLIASKKIRIKELITHRFSFNKAINVYNDILSGKERYLGVLFYYDKNKKFSKYFDEKIKIKENIKHSLKNQNMCIGVIGAGLFAKTTLLPNISKFKNVFLKTIVTTQGYTCYSSAKKFGFQYASTKIEDVLDDTSINSVFVVTNNENHASLVKRALVMGKNVFVEKPLALNKQELDGIIESYNNSNGQIMVGYNRRFSPTAIKGKELLSEVEGKYLFNIRINIGNIPEKYKLRDTQDFRLQIVNEIGHFVDLMQFFTEAEPVYVFAEKIDDIFSHYGENNILISIKFNDGSVGSIAYMTMGIKSFPRERIEIFKGNSVFLIDNFKSYIFKSLNKRVSKKSLNIDRGHSKEFKNFLKCISENKKFPVDFKSYIFTSLTTFAILESIKKAKRIKILF